MPNTDEMAESLGVTREELTKLQDRLFRSVVLALDHETSDDTDEDLTRACDVFGWDEMPTLTKDRELFVLRCGSNEQFVYLNGSDDPMRCPKLDHVGLSVGTPEELGAMHERAHKWMERDPDVEVTVRGLDDFGVLKLHNFYLRYRLPMMFEVQCFEWAK